MCRIAIAVTQMARSSNAADNCERDEALVRWAAVSRDRRPGLYAPLPSLDGHV